MDLRFKFHPQVFKVLGERKYSNYLEAINEIVADALDGFATKVSVFVRPDSITIEDDGEGMSRQFIENEYLVIGKPNPEARKRGLFGIGKLACQALASTTELESHTAKSPRGVRLVIEWGSFWDRPDAAECPISSEEIHSDATRHGTRVALLGVRSEVDPEQLREYLGRKHFPLLTNPAQKITIQVNGKPCQPELPRGEKFEFDSTQDFVLNGDLVPAQHHAKFGRVSGVIYLTESGNLDNAIEVFDRLGQRLDKYSTADWLGMRAKLERGAAFSTRVIGIVNTTTEVQLGESIAQGNALLLKSDRSGFFEDTLSFRQFVAYLIGRRDEAGLNLPSGGILRLIHKRWLEDQGHSPTRLEKMAQKEVPRVVSILSSILKGERFVWKAEPNGKQKEKPAKHRDGEEKPFREPTNKRLKCPYCGAINYISLIQYRIWVGATEAAKEKMRKNWPCKVCGTYLDPDKDLHRIASPPKLPRPTIQKVDLGEGRLVDLLIDSMGPKGDIASYSIGDEALLINRDHALFLRAADLGPEALRHHMVQAAVFAVAMARHRELQEDFVNVYNHLCSKAAEPWDETK
jgi:hypothetical protein